MRGRLRASFLACAISGVLAGSAAAATPPCANPNALGVGRTVEIDTTGGPGFGFEHYKAFDFLQPKEVVLTFDDGPQKFSTESILTALAEQCTRATFFSIGKMALGYPEIIREVAKGGHTIGTHTWSHKPIAKLKTFEEGRDEIERGVSAVRRAAGVPISPFFRFPTLVDTKEAIAYLGQRNIAMFSTDVDSFDFKLQSADHLVKGVMDKLEKKGKGIVLMHDIHKTTAKALPLLLTALKSKGYKIVHLTAKNAVETVAEFDAAIEKDAKGLPVAGAERPTSSVVKTVSGEAPPGENASGPASSEGAAGATAARTAGESAEQGKTAAGTTTEATPAAAAATPGGTTFVPTQSADTQNAPTQSASPQNVTVTPAEATKNVTAGAAEAPAAGKVEGNASPVATVGGPGATGSISAGSDSATGRATPVDAESSPGSASPGSGPAKSLSEKFNEIWEMWFGK